MWAYQLSYRHRIFCWFCIQYNIPYSSSHKWRDVWFKAFQNHGKLFAQQYSVATSAIFNGLLIEHAFKSVAIQTGNVGCSRESWSPLFYPSIDWSPYSNHLNASKQMCTRYTGYNIYAYAIIYLFIYIYMFIYMYSSPSCLPDLLDLVGPYKGYLHHGLNRGVTNHHELSSLHPLF